MAMRKVDSMGVRVKGPKEVYRGRFGEIDRYDVEYDLFNEDTAEAILEIGTTKDVVAVFLFHPSNREVILRERFQFATYFNGLNKGWMQTTFSVKLKSREVADETRVPELMKKFNMKINTITHIATFFSAADRLTQRVFLYFAEGHIHRREDDDEDDDTDARTCRIDLDEFFDLLAARKYEDPNLIIAGQWLRAERKRAEDVLDDDGDEDAPTSSGWRGKGRGPRGERGGRPSGEGVRYAGADRPRGEDPKLVADFAGGRHGRDDDDESSSDEREPRTEAERNLRAAINQRREDETDLQIDREIEREDEQRLAADKERRRQDQCNVRESRDREREGARNLLTELDRKSGDIVDDDDAPVVRPNKKPRIQRLFIGVLAAVVVGLLVVVGLIVAGNSGN